MGFHGVPTDGCKWFTPDAMVYRNSWFLESRVTSATGALDVVVRTSAGFREIQSQRFAAIIGSVGFSLEHYCLLLEFASTDVGIATNVCCFILLTRYWGIVTVPGFLRVDRPQILTSGGRIVTLHLNYVADYTGPLLFLVTGRPAGPPEAKLPQNFLGGGILKGTGNREQGTGNMPCSPSRGNMGWSFSGTNFLPNC